MEQRFAACFQAWIRLQESDLDELVQMAAREDAASEAELRELLQKNMRHYEEYYQQRRLMVHEHAPSFLCPHWCNPFETSFQWMGGCRPSLFFRLLYSLTSSAAEAIVQEIMSGEAAADIDGAVMGLSPEQLRRVNELHMATVREEDRISSRMATLQESVADKPLLPFALVRERRRRAAGANGGREVGRVMVGYEDRLAELLEAADGQRIATARELLTEILTPKQALELLTAAKRLHLSLHEWGAELAPGPDGHDLNA